MRSFFVSACLVSTMCTGMAVAQSPVAYVYVAEDNSYTAGSGTSPITAYAAFSDGKLTPLPGSPFTHVSGLMYGTNGTHFITVDENNTTHEYLRVTVLRPMAPLGKKYRSRTCMNGAGQTARRSSITPVSLYTCWNPTSAAVAI
jgi:hypothetical protein